MEMEPCRLRGYLFQSSEIYGGLNGFRDYGPLGVELSNATSMEGAGGDMIHRAGRAATLAGAAVAVRHGGQPRLLHHHASAGAGVRPLL